MASYTMQLREYIEMWSQHAPTSTRETIEIGRPKLFDFDYPIFDSDYKKVLETHFIRNFYTREIGFETEGLFKFHLETWLLVNMPYYNKLFESELLEFNPLQNSEMNVTSTKTKDKEQNDTTNATTDSTGQSVTDSTNESHADGTSTDDNFTRELESNNPDSRLSITSNDGEGVIEYASQIDETNTNNKNTSSSDVNETGNQTTNDSANSTQNATLNSDINETEDYIQHRVGKIGVQSYSKMVMEYRASFLRIEKQMFEEMQQLFMLVY